MPILLFWLLVHLTTVGSRFIFAMAAVQLPVTKQRGWQASPEVLTQEAMVLRSCFALSAWPVWKMYKTSTGCWPYTSTTLNVKNNLLPPPRSCFPLFDPLLFLLLFFLFLLILQNSLGLLSLYVLQHYWHFGQTNVNALLPEKELKGPGRGSQQAQPWCVLCCGLIGSMSHLHDFLARDRNKGNLVHQPLGNTASSINRDYCLNAMNLCTRKWAGVCQNNVMLFFKMFKYYKILMEVKM